MVDLEKVHDLVEGQFLDYMLGRMGFGEKWVKADMGMHHHIFFILIT